MTYRTDESLYPVVHPPRSRWERTGLTGRQEKVLDISLACLLALFTAGWLYSAVEAVGRGDAPGIARQIGAAGAPIGRDAPPDAAFTMNALVERLIDWDEVRGASGQIQVVIQEIGDTLLLPDAVPEEVALTYVPAGAEIPDTAALVGAPEAPPGRAGIWNLLLSIRGAIRPVPDLNVVTLVPSTALRSGRIGEYRIGQWPRGEGAYAAPRGFVEVTPENMDMHVSTHFRLRDFLTKGQEGVWPKYVVISPRLLDKLELTLQELEAMGHPVENVFVVSGFRTPWYNQHGGNPQGRGAMSRHMYGDAADIAIDNDHSGCMDDLNGDGRVDVQDARIVAEAAERVERKHPHLIGGIGIYRPVRGSHCGMVHIDARGTRARW